MIGNTFSQVTTSIFIPIEFKKTSKKYLKCLTIQTQTAFRLEKPFIVKLFMKKNVLFLNHLLYKFL